jgi:hypothetical protein
MNSVFYTNIPLADPKYEECLEVWRKLSQDINNFD